MLDWRDAWGAPDLPFLLVQLGAVGRATPKQPPNQSQYAELRDAARDVSQALPHTGLVVSADLGLSPDGQRIGERLAAVALEVAYGQGSQSPLATFDSLVVTKEGVDIAFAPPASRLRKVGDSVTGFIVQDRRGALRWAQGDVSGNVVSLHCTNHETAIGARYGWSDAPQLSLMDDRGLPLSPFRTHDFVTLMPWDQNVTYGIIGKHRLGAMLFLPWKRHPKPWPVIVFIHGGGWRSGTPYSFTWHAHRLAEQGFAGLSIRYRLSQQAPFPACLEDAKCAIRWVRTNAQTYGFDPTRIAVVGQSAGAHISALVAATGDRSEFEGNGGHTDQSSAVQAAVLINGVYDFRQYWEDDALHRFTTVRACVPELIGAPFSDAPERYDRASPIRYLSATAPPCLLFHSKPDDVVPFAESIAFSDKLREVGAPLAQVVLSDQGGHGWAMGSHINACYDAMERFLIEQLKPVTRE